MCKKGPIIAWLAIILAITGGCAGGKQEPGQPRNVAILVLDDFKDPPPAPPAGKPAVPPTLPPKETTPVRGDEPGNQTDASPLKSKPHNNCAYVGMPASDVGSTGAPGDLVDISHGEAVYQTLTTALAELFKRAGEKKSWTKEDFELNDGWVRKSVEGWTYENKRLAAFGVDTEGLDTGTIAGRLGMMIDNLKRKGFTGFVLNMSFVLAPCDVSHWLSMILAKNPTLRTQYVELLNEDKEDSQVGALHAMLRDLTGKGQLAEDEGTKLLNAWRKALDDAAQPVWRRIGFFYKPLTAESIKPYLDKQEKLPGTNSATQAVLMQVYRDDPLRQLLKNHTVDVIPVGAAGNGVSPRWGTIYKARPLPFPYAPALWDEVVSASASGPKEPDPRYSNAGEFELDGKTVVRLPAGQKSINGTSFAAARLSAIEGAYLFNGGPARCSDDVRPALGYAGPSNLKWDNLPMAQADRPCPGFISLTVIPRPSPSPSPSA